MVSDETGGRTREVLGHECLKLFLITVPVPVSAPLGGSGGSSLPFYFTSTSAGVTSALRPGVTLPLLALR